MYSKTFAILAAFLLITTAADARSSANSSVRVAAGESLNEDVSSVNGSVTVGADADLQGDAETVNGSVQIEDGARTHNISSVNGGIRIGERVTVDGDIESVNGSLRVGEDSTVSGHVETVNGGIDLSGVTIERSVRTVTGKIVLDRGTRIEGDIVVRESRGWNGWGGRRQVQEIELRDGSIVTGDILVEDDERKVRVTLSGGSVVQGRIQGAEVVQE